MTMRSSIALAGLAAFALTSVPALAGGIGVATTVGVHQEEVYWYDAALDQQFESQARPTYGGGLQIILGDKDDKVQGLVKFYGLGDAAPTAPSDAGNADYVALREEMRSVGYASAGIQWGLTGDPDAFMFCLNTSLGSGFLTSDMLEYANAEVGPAFTYMLADTIQLNGELVGSVRYRKGFTLASGVGVGVRYLFD